MPDDRDGVSLVGRIRGGGAETVQRPDVRRIPWDVVWWWSAVVEVCAVVVDQRRRSPRLFAPANVSIVATVVYLSGESWWTTVTLPSPPFGI